MDGAGYQVAELAGGKLEELGQVAWVATLINGRSKPILILFVG